MSDVLELGGKRAAEIGLIRDGGTGSYSAEAVHRLLGEGVKTYTNSFTKSNYHRRLSDDDDMVALQIAIRLIAKPDTAENLLKDIVYNHTVSANCFLENAISRAKAFLEKGEK